MRPRPVALARGLRGRCGNCGGRGILAGPLELRERCRGCGLSFVREEGYWVGAMTVIMALVIVTFAAFFVGGMLLTWPDVPWTPLLVGGLVINGLLPFLAYSWAKAVWLGLDLTFNPVQPEDPADDA